MTTINRVKLIWSGFTGAPGVSVLYTLDPNLLMTNIRAAIFDHAGSFPLNVNMAFEGFGDVINDATGEITGAWAAMPPAIVLGTQAGPYSAPSGLVVTEHTTGIVHGHKVRGRMFLVPLSGDSYDATGDLSEAVRGGFEDRFNTAVVALGLNWLVWSRPVTAKEFAKNPKVPVRAGSSYPVTRVTVGRRPAVLKSRRD